PPASDPSAEERKRAWQNLAAAAAERLRDRAALEEARPDADFAFSHDASRVARALDTTIPAAEGKVAAESLRRFEEALRAVEADKKMAETAKRLQDLAAREAFRADQPAAAAELPRAWQEAEAQAAAAQRALEKAQLPPEKRQRWANLLQDQDAQRSREEMARRQASGQAASDISEPLAALQQKAEAARQAVRPEVEAARQRIAEAAPRLHEDMAKLAKGFRQLAHQAEAAAGAKAEKGAAAEALADHKEVAKETQRLQADLRRDANRQDMTTAEGRSRSRDAEDALARLQRPPPTVEDFLRDAMAARDDKARERALRAAAEAAKAAAADLELLARHYRSLESGKAEAESTRQALRKGESEELKKALDQRYAAAERLTEAMRLPAAEAAKRLAAEAKGNAAMRREMADIARQAAAAAKAKLNAAAQAEAEIGKALANLPDAAPPNAAALQQAYKAWTDAEAEAKVKGAEASRAQAAAERQQRLARAMQETGHPEAPQAQAAAHQAAQEAAQKAQAAQAAAQQAQNAFQQLTQAAQADPSQAALTRLAQQQSEAAEKAVAAVADLQRAARHAARLGEAEAGTKAENLARQVERLGQAEIGKARQTVQPGQSPAPARPAVEAARQGLAKAAQEAEAAESRMLARLRAEELQAAGDEATARLGKWLARALDAAERQAAEGQQAAPGENRQVQAALARAAQEQRAAMAAARSPAPAASPSASDANLMASASGGSSPPSAPEAAPGAAGENLSSGSGDWGRLRRRDASDLAAGRKEEVSEEYRAMVEAYFKAVAAESRR
ncbi:MAG: hypothetical protein N3A66_02060, partial [Planctomycetota bacterium]|nr:hypothetical protein [Planctomycetota bacterium]